MKKLLLLIIVVLSSQSNGYAQTERWKLVKYGIFGESGSSRLYTAVH